MPSDLTAERQRPQGADQIESRKKRGCAAPTLLGGATEVGDNVVIGGNAFLTESVESDTKVSIKKPEMTFRVKGGRF